MIAIRKSNRTRKVVDYAMANKTGFVGENTLEISEPVGTEGSDRANINGNLGDSSGQETQGQIHGLNDQKPIGKIEFIEKPLEGNLLDDNYWVSVKEEHDAVCEEKEKQMKLTERHVYLMKKRKALIEHERKLQIMNMQVKQLDEDEYLAHKRHEEFLIINRRRKAKVEEWFDKTQKTQRQGNKDERKSKNKTGKSHNRTRTKTGREADKTKDNKTPYDNSFPYDQIECNDGTISNNEGANPMGTDYIDIAHQNKSVNATGNDTIDTASQSKSANAIDKSHGYKQDINDMCTKPFQFCSDTGTRRMSMSKFSTHESFNSEERSRRSAHSKGRASKVSSSSASTTSRDSHSSLASSSKASTFFGNDSGEDTDAGSEVDNTTIRESKSHSSSKIRNKKDVKLRSGMYDKPNDDIIIKVKWAHNSLDYAYRSKSVAFNKLTYNQYIAGESKIIRICENLDELQGRLRIMNKIAYAMDESGEWEFCREYYAAVLVSIETGEEPWTSSFRRFENMLPRKLINVSSTKYRNSDIRSKQGGSNRPRIPEIIFCKEFQKGKCPETGDHAGKYKDERLTVTLRHICTKCWLKIKQKLKHPESSGACPFNDNREA